MLHQPFESLVSEEVTETQLVLFYDRLKFESLVSEEVTETVALADVANNCLRVL